MGTRRDGREAAAQFLYARDLQSDAGEDEFEAFWDLHSAPQPVRRFAETLIAGVTTHLGDVDRELTNAAENFSLERFSAIDRNILRIAVYELLFKEDVPRAVIINEAIEIAKRFGTSDSAGFVNGILDGIRKRHSPP